MSDDEWIRVLLAIAIGVLFLPRLLKNDGRKNTTGSKESNKNSKTARYSMLFVGFGAVVAVVLLLRFNPDIAFW